MRQALPGCGWPGQLRRIEERGTVWAGAAVYVSRGTSRSRRPTAVVTGKGLASVRQWTNPAGADGFLTFAAIDHARVVAAVRAGAPGPVELSGVIGSLRWQSAGLDGLGQVSACGRFVIFDPGDLEPLRRAYSLEQNGEALAIDSTAAGNDPRFRFAGGLAEGSRRIGEFLLPSERRQPLRSGRLPPSVREKAA